MKRAVRPRVICHMTTSLDGRIVVDGWPESAASAARREYEQLHATFGAEGWICGRVTMEPFAKKLRSEAATEHTTGVPREDFVAPGDHESFAFAIDPSGRLAWETNDISGDHVVAILSERVSDDYLAFLRQRGVSYVLAGNNEVDLPRALQKIGRHFRVKTLMLEGGGRINGGLLHTGLIDEVSVLVAPVADGRVGSASLFDVEGEDFTPCRLILESMERRADDVLWLRYRVVAPDADQ